MNGVYSSVSLVPDTSHQLPSADNARCNHSIFAGQVKVAVTLGCGRIPRMGLDRDSTF